MQSEHLKAKSEKPLIVSHLLFIWANGASIHYYNSLRCSCMCNGFAKMTYWIDIALRTQLLLLLLLPPKENRGAWRLAESECEYMYKNRTVSRWIEDGFSNIVLRDKFQWYQRDERYAITLNQAFCVDKCRTFQRYTYTYKRYVVHACVRMRVCC